MNKKIITIILLLFFNVSLIFIYVKLDIFTITKKEPIQNTIPKIISNFDSKPNELNELLASKDSEISFFASIFQIDKEVLINKIIENNKNNLVENNIGHLENNQILEIYPSFEMGLIEYLFKLKNEEKNLFKNDYIPYNGEAEYVENLIKYYCKIYKNVDETLALSIGAAESGYYKVKYMLNYNNVYGGMSGTGLIKYKNIEYGTLIYIRMLSVNYYLEGLTTKEQIGRKYCPVYDDFGNKVASSNWLNLVTKAEDYYSKKINSSP